MSQRDDIFTPVGERVFVGLSSVIQVTPLPGQNGVVIKGITLTTLEIGSATLSWGNGYPIAAGEALSFNGCGSFYLVATGVTASVALFRGRSEGFDQV